MTPPLRGRRACAKSEPAAGGGEAGGWTGCPAGRGALAIRSAWPVSRPVREIGQAVEDEPAGSRLALSMSVCILITRLNDALEKRWKVPEDQNTGMPACSLAVLVVLACVARRQRAATLCSNPVSNRLRSLEWIRLHAAARKLMFACPGGVKNRPVGLGASRRGPCEAEADGRRSVPTTGRRDGDGELTWLAEPPRRCRGLRTLILVRGLLPCRSPDGWRGWRGCGRGGRGSLSVMWSSLLFE